MLEATVDDQAEAEAAAALTLARALAAAAREACGAETSLVSITCDLIRRPQPHEPLTPRVEIARATKTLVFATADLFGQDGRRLMTASAVRRILPAAS